MRSKRIHLVKNGAIVLVALAVLLLILERAVTSLQCRSTLQVFHYRIHLFRSENNGHYPPDLVTLASFTLGQQDNIGTDNKLNYLLNCPAKRAWSRTSTNAPSESSYVYINWEPFFGTNDVPRNYPLVYDKHLGNHFGLGINILSSDRRFWDFRAHWLAEFAAKHPEYRLLVP